MNAVPSAPANQSSHRLALPPGFDLDGCRIESLLGKGGFALTYLATDTTLNFKVAIKELLPDGIATRARGATVVAQSEDLRDAWDWALKRFEEEARTLAQLRHPNIVRVLRLIRAHGTVYMVMEYVEGMHLGDWLQKFPRPAEASLRSLLTPILDGLEHVHQKRLLHRDISPENIFITRDGRPVLLDFGSARQDLGKTTSITAVVRHGYSPFEQYQAKSHQGPYTDLYALAGVMVTAMTGKKPPPATDRLANEAAFPPLTTQCRGRYSEGFCQAIDRAFAVRPQDRPQSIPLFVQMLNGAGAAPPMPSVPAMPAMPDQGRTMPVAGPQPNYSRTLTPLPLVSPPQPVARHSSSTGWLVAAVAGVVLCAAAAIWWFAGRGPDSETAKKLADQAAEISVLNQQLMGARSDAARAAKLRAEVEAKLAEAQRKLAAGTPGAGSTSGNHPSLLNAFAAASSQAMFNTFGAVTELYLLHSNGVFDASKTVALAKDYKTLLGNIRQSFENLASSGSLSSGDVTYVREYIAANDKLSLLTQRVIDITSNPSDANTSAYDQIRQDAWKSIAALLGIK